MVVLFLAMVGLSVASALIWREQGRTARALEAESNHRQLLGANLKLALQALDKIYLTTAEARISRSDQLDPKDRELLQEALAFYDRFSETNRDNLYVRYEVASAHGRAGDIRYRLGDKPGAHDSLQRSIALLESLTSDFPVSRRANGWPRFAIAWPFCWKISAGSTKRSGPTTRR